MPSKKKNEEWSTFIAVSVITWIIISVWMLVSRSIEYMETQAPHLPFEMWVMGTLLAIMFFAFVLHEKEGP